MIRPLSRLVADTGVPLLDSRRTFLFPVGFGVFSYFSDEVGELSVPCSPLSRKMNTFSGVGFGHDKIPFLSTQHNAVTDPKTTRLYPSLIFKIHT